jgi:hypothetical protein
MIKLLNWIAGLQPTSNKRVPREEDPPGLVQSEARGYLIPHAVVVHPNKVEMAALEHLKIEPGVVQKCQPGELIAIPPAPGSKPEPMAYWAGEIAATVPASLRQAVRQAIDNELFGDESVPVLLVVAEWLRSRGGHTCAAYLEREAAK